MTEENKDSLRIAVITSNEATPILEAIETSLPEGYMLKEIEQDKKSGNYDIVIETPNDEICLVVAKDGLSAKTSNVMKQDEFKVQPSLANDELSKLAVLLNESETTKVSMQVMASNDDLKGI